MFRPAAPALDVPCSRSLAAALVGLVLAACGQPASSNTGGDLTDALGNLTDLMSGGDGNKQDGSKADAVKPEDGSSDDMTGGEDTGSDGTSPGGDGSGSTDTADGGGTGCEFPAKPLPGEPGAACKDNGECDSGACIDGPTGKICTSNCSACCPTGYKCEPFQTTGGDTTQVCQPKWLALCRPCETDAECTKIGKGSLCVTYGGAGSFCGGSCQADSDCPSDFQCQDAQGEKGAGKQCVRTTGECSCSPAAIADGAQTTCYVDNSAGKCTAIRKCTLNGLNACAAATPAAETCGNNQDDDCNGQTDEDGAKGCTQVWQDADGDKDGKLGSSSKCMCTPAGLFSATTATDCDDADKTINGSTLEVCDGIDNNCDGKTDEGCDDDGDGYCDVDMAVVGNPVVCKKSGKDCDDNAVTINPGAQEQCGNNIDDDCDGLTDSGPNVSGCVPFYADNDGDAWGAGDPVCQCAAKGIYTATKTGDCADNDPKVNPAATETCGDNKDDDCNGLTDEVGASGCTPYYTDLDGDTFGTAAPACLCAPDASHTALKSGDCDDSALGINPAATETCNGVDDDCDGTIDEMGAQGCTTFYMDADGDTFGNPGTGLCLCQKTPLSNTAIGGDCNDDSAAAHPGAGELCDGLDNDCDGLTDEQDAQGCTAFYADGDNDGWGDSTKSACLCAANPSFKVAKLGDCNDGDASVNPAAKEFCDGVDNNCLDGVDEAGAQGCSTFWRDHDGDKYGSLTDSACLCVASGEFTSKQTGDCNDNDKTVNPKATETCDGVDNDCDGATDPVNSDGCTAWYVDKDGDNWGATNLPSKCLCAGTTGFSNQWGDCADSDATVNPDATEICNGKDDNCDGSKDAEGSSGCVAYYVDGDKDSYGVNSVPSRCLCSANGAWTAMLKDDCNDSDVAVNPGATEACNGVDDNCNGQTDEGLVATYFVDADLDGYGAIGTGVTLCGPDATHKVATGGDCDDGKFGVNPGASEVCNGLDDNCNSQTDESLPTATYYQDGDGDGYGSGLGNQQCGPFGSYTTVVGGDCNDAAFSVNPGAAETCNSIDDNCNSSVDEGLAVIAYYIDSDGDGFGNPNVSLNACAKPNGYVQNNADCNDTKPTINPAAQEVCSNSLDDNCNGATDEGCANACVEGGVLFDFEDGVIPPAGITADSMWKSFAPGFNASKFSVEYADTANTHGYTPDFLGNARAFKGNIVLPAGTTGVTVDVSFDPKYKFCIFFCSTSTDTSATMVIDINGVQKTLVGGTDTTGTYTVKLPAALSVATSVPFSISVTTNQLAGSASGSARLGFDNIKTTCVP